jgi:3-oxoacyl-[acyl-carrier protein] reductase
MNVNYPPLNTLISLNGKRALITGSGAGIGSAMAYRFAEAGANLELVDINEQALRVLKENLGTFNVEINAYKADLSNKKDIDTLWEKLSGKEPDILVNNAGIYPTKPFLEVDESFLRKTMSLNLESVF